MQNRRSLHSTLSLSLVGLLALTLFSSSLLSGNANDTFLFGIDKIKANNIAEATTASSLQCFTPDCEAHARVFEEFVNGRSMINNGMQKIDYKYQLEGDLKFDASRDVFYPSGTWQVSCDYTYYFTEINPFDPNQPTNFQLLTLGSISGAYPGSADLGVVEDHVTGEFIYTYDSGHQPIGVVGAAKIPMHFDPMGPTSGPCQAGIANWNDPNVPYASLTKNPDGTLTASSSFDDTQPNPPQDPDHSTFQLHRTGEFIAFTGNRPPVANAGPDLPSGSETSIKAGDTVTLAGSGSDPDNDPITFQWGQIEGEPTVTLSGDTTDTATFTAPRVETETQFTFKLTVTDDKGASDEDSATVTVTAGDFSLDCEPISGQVNVGNTAKTKCTVTSLNGFDSKVDLKCESPDNPQITCGLSPTPVTPPVGGSIDSTLVASVDTNSPLGTFDLKVTGTATGSGGNQITRSVNVPIEVVSSEFRIGFSTFIPTNNVQGPPSFFCFPPGFNSHKSAIILHGDDRNFDPNSDSYRSRQLVTVVTGTDSDGIKDGTTPQSLTGVSKGYAEDALADDGKLGPNDDDDVTNDCHLLDRMTKASTSGMHIAVQKISDTKTSVHMFGGAALPFKNDAPGLPAPDIDWDFTITIDTSGEKPSWTLTGKHDGFPAYEIYIDDQPIYQKTPGSGPYTFSDVKKLYPPMDVSVSKTGTL